jgi:tRNA U34 2-thiouridine synthase MnmA/TrmU
MKAIALISGGLDSTLAAGLIERQGIEVVPLHFKIGFAHRDREVTNNLDIEPKIIDVAQDFLDILKNPRYGFGSNMNPCIDCKIFMLAKAKDLMPEFNAEFVVTGEVLGQRPMSQNRQTLRLIEEKSGLEGLLLRPLSAKLLSETIPEQKGWVSRDKLLDFNGRSRKPQLELARTLGIKGFAQPAGGCLLTDPEFSKRLKDLIAHQELNSDNVELLKIGRHFRLADNAKLIVGRNEEEDSRLLEMGQDNDYLFLPPEETAGPTSLGRGILSQKLIQLACGITAHYCKFNGSAKQEIVYKILHRPEEYRLVIKAIAQEEIVSLRI